MLESHRLGVVFEVRRLATKLLDRCGCTVHCPDTLLKLKLVPCLSLYKNMEYMSDGEFIEVYVCQKLLQYIKFWQSYCKNKKVQFCCLTWYTISRCPNFHCNGKIISIYFCLELGGFCTRSPLDFAHPAHLIVTPLQITAMLHNFKLSVHWNVLLQHSQIRFRS